MLVEPLWSADVNAVLALGLTERDETMDCIALGVSSVSTDPGDPRYRTFAMRCGVQLKAIGTQQKGRPRRP